MKILLTVAACVGASAGWAEAPRVVTDIAPVHSLVSMIMGDLGKVDLIVPPAASPHDHAMRPSEARALADANIVVWMGPALTPWLEESIEALAPDAAHLALQDFAPQTLPFRDGAQFEAHEHEEHNHADEHEDEHAEDVDPHMWLDPMNARAWLTEVTIALVAQDAENAEVYHQNAAKAAVQIDALSAQLQAQLTPLQGRPFVVFHDAFHYFEARFGVEAVGAISASNAQAPSPRRLREIEHAIEESGAVCVFTEPQFNAGIVQAVAGSVRIGTIDPTGFDLPLGPEMYGQLMTQIGDSFAACLAE
jgi:zinc transport system substrate-binding protein